ncbi:hypothetical protein EON65_09210 [archaeon]|nr:MAG: hypothetical protein EON65_09210 [archaeon]
MSCVFGKNKRKVIKDLEMRQKDLLASLDSGTIKLALGDYLMTEMSKALHTGVKKETMEYVEELEDKVKNAEDYISCLEEQVSELQNMIREMMEIEGTSEETSSTAHTKENTLGEREEQGKIVYKKSWGIWVKRRNSGKENDADKS